VKLAGLCPACLLQLALTADQGVDALTTDDEAWSPESVYRVVTVLSGDAAHTTYLAEDPHSGRLVTLDVVQLPAPMDDEARVAIDQRILELRRLAHSSIASVLDGRCSRGGQALVVAAFVKGLPIDRFAARAAGPARAEAFAQLCEAVSYAHAQGVCHGRLRASCAAVRTEGDNPIVTLTGFTVTPGAAATPENDVRDLAAIARLMGWTGEWPAADDSLASLRRAVTNGLARDA
jgi:hypothetical protein